MADSTEKNDRNPANYIGFDATKYARVGKAAADAVQVIDDSVVVESYMPFYVDGSDSYANRGMTVSFHHVPSKQNVYFKAFISAFTETYSSDWSEEMVYGRADPILLFKNTSRRVSITLLIPGASESEAFENLESVGKLARFLYPVYTDVNDASTIAQSPLCRLKIMNILMNQEYNNQTSFANFRSNGLNWGGAGILGAITSMSVNHHLEDPDAGVLEIANGVILPKLIEISIDFTIIHEHSLGWEEASTGASFDTAAFPYGADGQGEELDPVGEQASLASAIQTAQRELDSQDQELTEEPTGSEPVPEPNEAAEANFRARLGNAFSGIGSATRSAGRAIGDVGLAVSKYSGNFINDRRNARAERQQRREDEEVVDKLMSEIGFDLLD